MIPSMRATGLVLALAAAGCARPPPPTSQDAAAVAACRQTADRVYQTQNRGEVYETDRYETSGRDAPYSLGNLPGVTTRGLSGEYARDTMIGDCLKASGVSDATATSGAVAPSAVPPPLQHP
jgi:hypothetical protein